MGCLYDMQPILWKRALAAATTVFVLDGLYVVAVFAWMMGATTPQRIFQGIARALMGSGAFRRGASTAALGVAMHFGVALVWSIVWALLYARSARLQRTVANPVAAVLVGVAYGVAVHLAMQLVVLPLTHAPSAPLLSRGGLLVLLAHVLVVGPPIVMIVRGGELSLSSPP